MTGTLGLFSLVDLIQLLSGAGRTGRLLIQHPRGDAKLYFEQGEIVHALFAEFRGEDAVFALFEDERGPFSFHAGLAAMEHTVELGTQNLVLEAVRRLDEARRDQDAPVPYEADMVPELAGAVDPGRVTLGEGEHAVLAHVDGRRSLQRIAERCERPASEVSRIVGRLVAADVLVVRKRRPRTARLVVRPAGMRLPHRTAAVDPTIVQTWARSLGRTPDEIACRSEDGRVLRLGLVEHADAGPYLLVGRVTMMRTGLKVDETLLVRPHEEDA